MMYFQEIVVRTLEQFFMCERAIKWWPVGDVPALPGCRLLIWSVVNQTFGASGVFLSCPDMCGCSGELEIW